MRSGGKSSKALQGNTWLRGFAIGLQEGSKLSHHLMYYTVIREYELRGRASLLIVVLLGSLCSRKVSHNKRCFYT
jgi:hypothetical protein